MSTTTTTAPVDPLQRCTERIREITEAGRAEYTRICKAKEAFDRTDEPRSVNGPVAAEFRSLLEHRATQERLRAACVNFDLATYTGDLLDRADGAKAMLVAALDHVKARYSDAKKAKASLLAKIAAAVTSSTSTEEALPPTRPVMSGPFGNAPMDLDAELDLASKAISTFPWDTGYVEIVSKLNRIASELHQAEPPSPMPARMDRPFLVKEPTITKQPATPYTQAPLSTPIVQPKPAPRRASAIVGA